MFAVFHMGVEKIKQNPQNERERSFSSFCHLRYVVRDRLLYTLPVQRKTEIPVRFDKEQRTRVC